MSGSRPLIITAAINGAEVTREQAPSLPLTPSEVAEEVRRCDAAGARIVHLHGRRPDGTPTQDRETFRAYFSAIRAVSDIVVQFSTGGAIGMDVEERIAALTLRPEMATLTTGTCNFGSEVFFNDQATIETIARRLTALGIRPEIEVFEVGMLDQALRLVDRGLLTGPLHVDFVLGVPGAMAARESHLRYLVGLLPAGWTWCVAGIGRHELEMAGHAIALGGHVRVGLEDNLYVRKGVPAAGTWELVEVVASMASAAGRAIATLGEARSMLGVPVIREPDAS